MIISNFNQYSSIILFLLSTVIIIFSITGLIRLFIDLIKERKNKK